MEVKRFIALLTGGILMETGTSALDLNTASCFHLNVLDVGTAMADNCCSQIKIGDGF